MIQKPTPCGVSKTTWIAAVVLSFVVTSCDGQDLFDSDGAAPREVEQHELLTEAPPEEEPAKDFEEELNSVLGGLLARALPTAAKIVGSEYLTAECTNALVKTSQALRRKDAWALRMSTSAGGVPDNVFEGSRASLGSFEQCVKTRAVDASGKEDFKGMYCSLYLEPPEQFMQRMTERFNAIGQWKGRKSVSGWNSYPKGHFGGYRIGICAPSACEEEELDYVVQLALEDYGTNSTVRTCMTDDPVPISTFHTLIFSFIALSVGTVLLATCLELYDMKYRIQYSKRPILALPARMLLCFSCIGNVKRLTRTGQEPKTLGDSLQFLRGVKVASILWIILGNAYFTTQWDTFHNGNEAIDLPKKIPFQLVASSFLSVSTFFFISGFLLSYITLINEKKVYSTNYVGLYAVMVTRRYIRLTVPAIPVLLYFFLFPLFISGPTAKDQIGREVAGCYKNWWTLPAHAVNYVPYEERCMPHLWYASNDMQLFLISAAVAIMTVRSIVWAGCIALGLGSLGAYAAGYMTHSLNLFPALTVAPDDINRSIRTLDWTFSMPYSNAGPYFAGMVCGYLSVQWAHLKLHRVVELLFWTVALGTNAMLVFLPLLWNATEEAKQYKLVGYLYGGVHGLVWGMAWSWIFYACVTGRAELVRRTLSWKGFVVPARLTFGVYLVQHLVYLVRNGVTTTTVQLNEFLQVKDALGVAVISYFLALLLYLQYEAPMHNMLKLASDFLAHTYQEIKQNYAAKRKKKELLEDPLAGPTIVHVPDPRDPDFNLPMVTMSRQTSVAESVSPTPLSEGSVSPGSPDVDIDEIEMRMRETKMEVRL